MLGRLLSTSMMVGLGFCRWRKSLASLLMMVIWLFTSTMKTPSSRLEISEVSLLFSPVSTSWSLEMALPARLVILWRLVMSSSL